MHSYGNVEIWMADYDAAQAQNFCKETNTWSMETFDVSNTLCGGQVFDSPVDCVIRQYVNTTFVWNLWKIIVNFHGNCC